MKAVICNGAGDIDVLAVGDVPAPTVLPHQVLVQVRASGINRADILQRRGFYPPLPGESSILGLEIAGDIVQLGSDVRHLKVGQRVFGLVGGGGHAEYCCLDSEMAIEIPAEWSYKTAAAIPEVFLTAQEALFTQAQLKSDETIFIQAAASGVGTAMVQMAKHRGAKIYFTASTPEKIKAVCAMGADKGFLSTDHNWVEALQSESGIDVIIDFIGASVFAEHLSLLQTGGRLVQLALMGGSKIECDLRVLLQKRLTIMGSTLRARTHAEKRDITQRFCEEWLPPLIEGYLTPVIDSVYPYTEVAKAHTKLESRKTIGKLILTW